MKRVLLCVLFLGYSFLANAQVVTLTPAIVTQNDTVTVTFDATQGNAGLVGVNQVYMHTGVITNLSTSPTNWRHVQGNWGVHDPKVQMTNIGNNKHQLTYHINSFYNIPSNETVEKLAFVFRNVDGSKEGKSATNSDIFVPISQGGYSAFFNSHPFRQYLYQQGDTMKLEMVAATPSTIELYMDTMTNLIASDTNTTSFNFDLITNNYSPGFHGLVMKATNADGTQTSYDTASYISRAGQPIGVLPPYAEEGIKAINDSTMYFQVRAPYKTFAYIKGDFNDWLLKPEYEMYKDPSGQFFFGEITGLDKNTEYAFQYAIGETQRTYISYADPYAEKVLVPYDDYFIQDSVYPNLKEYPYGLTTKIVSTFQIEEAAYNWNNAYNYQRPQQEELVIYELLIRDFTEAHNYNGVINRLDYLQALGINAIELMPVMEFEGNESWGYNPIFMMAPDKYYGPKNELKRFVDSCHAKGIAVILDIALNHQFGQSPMVQMYFDPTAGQWGQPTAQSPWFNQVPKHDFNVGYDFNHESPATKYFTKKVIKHWVEEYKIDGYRFDLSKGFTQKNTLGNVAAWGQYDQTRINIWNDYTNYLWSVDSNLFVILEHFAENSEETVLSNNGMLLWGNMNHAYNEGTMGYSTNLTGVSHQSRNWNDMHLVGFMESHDEERLVYKNVNFGNSNSSYSTKVLDTALQRVELASVFFYTIPGPKMLWQFGELGYDYSINDCGNGTVDPNCRTYAKPLRWDYFTEPERRQVYNVMGELNHLRQTYPVFRKDKNHQLSLSGMAKRIKLADSAMNVVVLGNFDIVPKNIDPDFHQTGWWYEHFTGDSINVTNPNDLINLAPGEYRLYTTIKLQKSSIGIEDLDPEQTTSAVHVYPTAFTDHVTFQLSHLKGETQFFVYDLQGRLVWNHHVQVTDVFQTVEWNANQSSLPLAPGVYIYKVVNASSTYRGKVLKH